MSAWLLLLLVMALAVSSQIAPVKAQSQTATASSQPSPTPSTTPVPYLQLPDWMRDPDTQVIALFTYGDTSNDRGGATFLNLETGERFLPGLDYVDEIGWIDSPDGVYIHLKRYQSSGADNSEGFHEYLDLDSGSLVRLPIGDMRAPVSRTPAAPEVDNGSGVRYRLVARTGWEAANRDHTAYWLLTYGDIILTNAGTGRSLSLYDNQLAGMGLRQLTVQWFGEGRWLGVWYTREEDGMFRDEVNIFDSDGNWRVSYGDFSQVRWSAAHSFMLFRDGSQEDAICIEEFDERYPYATDCEFFPVWQRENGSQIVDYQWSGRNIVFTYRRDDGQRGGLCRVDVDSRAVECPLERSVENGNFAGSYHQLAGNAYGYFVFRNTLIGDDYFDMEIPRESGVCLIRQRDFMVNCVTDGLLPTDTYMRWESLSPSGELLALTYTGQEYERHDGVCFVSLQTGDARCPDAPEIVGFIDTYGWSPDSRYFLTMYNGGGRESDDKSYTRFGIFDAPAGTYRDEGFAMYEHDLTDLWRPALTP